MATYRPKLGYSVWAGAPKPVTRKYDWPKVGIWVGGMAFCVGTWVVVILACAKAVK